MTEDDDNRGMEMLGFLLIYLLIIAIVITLVLIFGVSGWV